MRGFGVLLISLVLLLSIPRLPAAQNLQNQRPLEAAADLSEIVLNIAPNQVVNQPLLVDAQAFLLDSLSAFLTDYDLVANPITLIPAQGTLVPDVLNDQSLFNAGVVDFLSSNVTYVGRSGVVEIHASSAGITSSGVNVSFNGYDILDASDFKGDPISTIYAGISTDTIHVTVQNRGNQAANTDPYVKSYFRSGTGGSVKHYFSANADGVIDTVSFMLENTFLAAGEDTLVLELTSEYLIDGTIYPTTDTMAIPVSVFAPPSFAVVDGSVVPDAVYAGPVFDVAFDVRASDFPGQIDRTTLAVYLAASDGGPAVATIYDGEPTHTSYVDSVISYSGITAMIDTADGLSPGSYHLLFEFRLTSGENSFALTDSYPDSLLLVPEAGIQYVTGTLDPMAVAAGGEVSFEFEVEFDDASLPLVIHPDSAVFTIAGDGFMQSVNLVFPADTLDVGAFLSAAQLTVAVGTELMIIPADLLGQDLTAAARFTYSAPDVANALKFATDFDSVMISVVAFPAVQIIDLSIVSPNAPRVSTNQDFQISCLVSSQSSSGLTDVDLVLSSDGNSVFLPDANVAAADPFDTVEVFFYITSGSLPDDEEIFSVDIVPDGHEILAPVDDEARLTIETPAELNLQYSLSIGAADGLVEFGESFSLLINLNNSGEAEVVPGSYSLTTGGVDFGLPDPTVGVIDEDSTLVFFLTAPEFDANVAIRFVIDQRPVETNTGLPAMISDTSFEAPLEVVSTVADLFVEPVPPSSNVVAPGQTRELFSLNLSNTGVSSIADMQVMTISMSFVDPSGQPHNVRSLIETGNTGFYEEETKVASAVAGQDRLVMFFDDFPLPSNTTRTIDFRTRFKEGLGNSFSIALDETQIAVLFVDERMEGQTVEIVSDVEDTLLVSQTFAAAGGELETSFIVETNPWNPLEDEDGVVRFSYTLEEAASLEFYILTLIGEKVLSRFVAQGDVGTEPGSHFLEWDGRNDQGEMVLNGVYVVLLRNADSGAKGVLKIAVVK